MEQINSLLEEILKIPGQKIATLGSSSGSFKIDIDETGNLGYKEGLKEFFAAKLLRAMNEGGGLIIRAFLPFKVNRQAPDGKEMWLPEKELYGVFLGGGTWRGLNASTVREIHCLDPKTNQILEPEEGVHFRDFPYTSYKG